MKMKADCPGCGQSVDYDKLPKYSAVKQRAGVFCPNTACNFPLDEATAKTETQDYGAASAEIHAQRLELAKAFHAPFKAAADKAANEAAEKAAKGNKAA